MIHELKCWPVYFNALKSGIKNFEVRKNDRFYQYGDELLLKEYIPDDVYLEPGDEPGYTGRILHREITYILDGRLNFHSGLKDGYVVLGLKKI